MKQISQICFCLRLKFLKHKQANINVKSRRFSIIMTILLFTCKLPIHDLHSQWLTKDHVTRVILRMKKFSERCSG